MINQTKHHPIPTANKKQNSQKEVDLRTYRISYVAYRNDRKD
jgi:hypothetical protein